MQEGLDSLSGGSHKVYLATFSCAGDTELESRLAKLKKVMAALKERVQVTTETRL